MVPLEPSGQSHRWFPTCYGCGGDETMISVVENMRRFAFVAISRDHAIIWNEGLDSLNPPIRVEAPPEMKHRYMRPAQFHHGHDTDHLPPEYFEEIASHLDDGQSIVIMSHGKGKANYGLHLIDHLKAKHPEISSRVVDHLTVNIPALSTHELEAHARGWFEKNYKKLGSWHRRKADRRFT
jgi:hypothetical protein